MTKRILWIAALFAVAAAASVKADVIPMFSETTGLVLDGQYGNKGNTNDWVDCNAYTCDGRVIAINGTGAVSVTWECKAQLSDTDEQAYPCYDETAMTDASKGLYTTLATAAYYRLKLTNRASGSFKAWIVRVKR